MKVIFRIFSVLPLLLAALHASDDSQPEPRMMDLNVVALDAHGAPVTDLTRDDFRVFDAGSSQTIAFFRHRDNASAPNPHLAPNEVSNRSAANVPRATLLLLDLMNQEFSTRGITANALIHELETLESPDYVYLYLVTVNGGLYPIHGLPGAAGETAPEDGQPWTHHAKALIDQGMRTVLQVRDPDLRVSIDYRTQLTFQVLDQVAFLLSAVPGRKSIVWLTDGVPIELGPRRSGTGEWLDYTPLLRRMGEAMDRSDVSIYPVRSIMIGSPSNVNGANYDGTGALETLDMFAQMTGGRPDAGKDIGAALRQAMSDMRTSYQIGYYPPASAWDNKFHKLRITCSRKGVRIQAKTGYYAWREAAGAKSTQALLSALSARFDAAEIGLRASLAPIPQEPRAMRLDAHIDTHDVVLVHQGQSYDGQLRLAIAGMVPGATPQSSPLIPLDLHYTAAERDRALAEGIPFTQNVALSQEMEAVRLIVYDRGSEAIGSVTIPVPPAASRNPKP